MVKGYARVSSKGQVDNNSLEEQEQTIKNRYPDARIYKEIYSAATSVEDREVFSEILKTLIEGDVLVVTKLDRFCRNAREGLQVIEDLLNRKVAIHILNMGLIDDSSMGRLLVTVLLAFAEFERNMIVERTKAGKEIAKQSSDFKDGRPLKYTQKQIDYALELLDCKTYEQVSQMTGISKSTLVRAKRKIKIL